MKDGPRLVCLKSTLKESVQPEKVTILKKANNNDLSCANQQ